MYMYHPSYIEDTEDLLVDLEEIPEEVTSLLEVEDIPQEDQLLATISEDHATDAASKDILPEIVTQKGHHIM